MEYPEMKITILDTNSLDTVGEISVLVQWNKSK